MRRVARTACTNRLRRCDDAALPTPLERYADAALDDAERCTRRELRARLQRRRSTRSAPKASTLLKRWPARVAGSDRRGVSLPGARARGHAARTTPRSLSHQQIPKIAVPKLARLGRAAAFLMNENLPGAYPVHGGRLSLSARGGRPDAHVRGRGHAGAHQPPLPLPRGRSRGDAPVDGVRFDDALRRRSRTSGRTSTAAPATRASRSRRSTT